MATANAALPSMDKISMIGIWVETVVRYVWRYLCCMSPADTRILAGVK
jgi:hypothetical protein